MTKRRSEKDGSAESRRPWYRPHASTYVVLVLLLFLLALANVPGQVVVTPGFSGRHFDTIERLEHGWPATYLWRDRDYTSVPFSDLDIEWSALWSLTADVERFSRLGCCLPCSRAWRHRL